MKKVLSMLLTIVMVLGFGSFTFTGASAKTGEDGYQGTWDQNRGGLHKLSKMYKQEGQPSTEDPKEKEVIVQFADPDSADVSKTEAAKIDELETMAESGNAAKGKSSIEIADGITVQKDEVWEFDGNGEKKPLTVAVASSNNLSTKKMIKKLQSQNMIEAVSPNYSRHICSAGDSYSGYQWGLDSYPGISVEEEWAAGNSGSAENVVAVVDTGVYYKHEDLKGQMWNNPFGNKLKGSHGFDFVNGDGNPEDDNGHGTHCAGIIGAATNTDTPDEPGVQGVNPEVSIMALKVLDDYGDGYDSDIIAAFNYLYKAMDLGTNVVAVNCSFGGEDPDDVLGEVIEKVGKKGAVTVCAAGNEAMDCDELPSYPACYDSEYIISVAATKNSGDKAELVSFSNYGKDSVDIAAPGTDILSTVNYDCFNPTLYGNDGAIVQKYLDGTAPSIGEFTLTNMDLDDSDIIASENAAAFFSEEGLKIRFDQNHIQDSDNKFEYIAIPYDLPDDFMESPRDAEMSMMIRTLDGPQEIDIDQYFSGTFSKVLLLDVPRSFLDKDTEEGKAFLKTAGEDVLANYACEYQIVAGDDDYWTHLRTNLLAGEEDGEVYINTEGGLASVDLKNEMGSISKERALLILGDSQAGAFTAYVDDIGISKFTEDTSIFGKYDFYSGSSMATPYVTGAVALTAAAVKDKEDCSPEILRGEVLSMANDEPPIKVGGKSAINSEGSVDFAKKGSGFWVGVSSVTADKVKNQIKLKGRFGGVDSLKITIRKNGEDKEIQQDQIVSKTDKEIILRNDGWINNVVDITVEGTKNGKTKAATKRGIYVVKGKQNYAVFGEGKSEIAPDAAIATDGRQIYAAQSAGDSILLLDPRTSEFETYEIMGFTKDIVKKNFKSAKNMSKTATYDFRFGDDLVKIGNYLYVKGSFCEVAGKDQGDEEDGWSNDGQVSASEYSWDFDERFEDSTGAAYAEETYIFKIDIESGELVKKLPWPKNSNADMLTDSKLASFNSCLYLLGGINESESPEKAFSKKVYGYNASANTWSAKKDMPQGRAGGKVLQTGDRLIYTLGYCADNVQKEAAPANFVYDGKNWTKKSAGLSPVDGECAIASRGEEEYAYVDGNVGICAGGLVYMGAPAEDYGDTFTYNLGKDRYTATNFNYTKNLDELYELCAGDRAIGAVAVADRIIGFDAAGDIIGINKAVPSGLIRVAAGKVKNGKVAGAGYYMPGTVLQVRATANPGYYIKTLSVPGAAGKKNVSRGMTVSLTANKAVTAKVSTAKVKVSSVKKLTIKRGKSASLKAKIKPAAASKQWKLAFKSSKTKYAKVNAKGKVTAKKAGKGKTVKIKIMLKGTGKVLKTVKVKIK